MHALAHDRDVRKAAARDVHVAPTRAVGAGRDDFGTLATDKPPTSARAARLPAVREAVSIDLA